MNIPTGTWLIYVFSFEGSYLHDLERPASGASDTQQYWITDAEAWDVRTFAIDKDLRIQTLDYRGRVDEPVAYFDSVAQRTYGDVITARYRVDVPAGASVANIRDEISQLGLHPNVEWTALDFPLWLPEEAKYFSHDADSN
jgi:hypothetical protein